MLKRLMCNKLFLLALLFPVSFLTFEQNLEAVDYCSSSSYLVVHINGIMTTKDEARIILRESLTPAIGSTYDGENIKFVLAYNPTQDALDDLVDVLIQKLTEYPGVAKDLIFKAVVNAIFDSGIPQSLVEFVSDYHIGKIKNYGYLNYNDDDLREILGAIRSNIVENQKILLVPHSQGNLYANATYAALTSGDNAIPSNSIKIVGVASPAAYVAGNGAYLTSANDLVISGLRSLGLNVLSSNMTISFTSEDMLGHNFGDVYLNPNLEGRAKLIEKSHAAMDSLSIPGSQGSQGPITVTLTWGSQPDIDLHVFEPDGSHVYYYKKTGASGYLDVDDRNGYGPEHYYTSCSGLQIGTYEIGVNYYSGSGTETATVTMSTPFTTLTRKITLTTAKGTAGNTNPTYVGKIKVTKSSSSKYSYELI
jgi:hypothetical protein